MRTRVLLYLGIALLAGASSLIAVRLSPPEHLNVILVLSDDQGWGDVGYNRERANNPHPPLTPALDAMAANAIVFERFYVPASYCASSRAGMLTGRVPYRFGMKGNAGHIPHDTEITLAGAVKAAGYTTGHFGKWHVGSLSSAEYEEARDHFGHPSWLDQDYSPPWENGFDAGSSTWTSTPNFIPEDVATPYAYWRYPSGASGGVAERVPLPELRGDGDDAAVVMGQALGFIRAAVRERRPFLTTIWFHNPHIFNRFGEEWIARTFSARERRYIDGLPPAKDRSGDERRQYYYSLLAMDRQIARLRQELRSMGIARNTMVWFASDNGPSWPSAVLRGGKAQPFENGIRVPALLEWPAAVARPRVESAGVSGLDYYPTILDALDIDAPQGQPELDGESLLPLIESGSPRRNGPLGVVNHARGLAWLDRHEKLVVTWSRRCGTCVDVAFFDLEADPGERRDLARGKPDRFRALFGRMNGWLRNVGHPGFVPWRPPDEERGAGCESRFCARMDLPAGSG